MKRLYVLLTATFVCAVVLAQHPHSRGGSPFYWALVGAIVYGGIYIIYLLCGYLIKLIKIKKRNRARNLTSNETTDNETILKGSKVIDNTNKVETPENHQEESPNKFEVKQVYCRYCGKQIVEDALFCPRCGKRLFVSKASWNAERLRNIGKAIDHKILDIIRIQYNFIKKILVPQISDEQSSLWCKRIKRIGKVLLAVVIVVAILAGTAWGYSYYNDDYLPKKQLDEACQDVINKLHSNDKTVSLECCRKILLNSWAFSESSFQFENLGLSGNSDSNKNETWGYENVSDYEIMKRMRQYRAEAFRIIESEAYNGNSQIQYLLGRIYIGLLKYKGFDVYETEYAVAPDTVKAAYWWNEAAKQGYVPAYNSMGIAYKLGLGVDVDMRKAIDYLKKGAESGDSKAQCNYGDLYRDGVKIHTGSHVVREPQYVYGHYYGTENVTILDSVVILPKDIELAKSWWAKSAAQGNAIAKERLQKIYE